jgi:hypothetical protein
MLKPIAQPGTVRQIEYQLIHITSVASFRPACAKDQRRLAQQLVCHHVSSPGMPVSQRLRRIGRPSCAILRNCVTLSVDRRHVNHYQASPLTPVTTIHSLDVQTPLPPPKDNRRLCFTI